MLIVLLVGSSVYWNIQNWQLSSENQKHLSDLKVQSQRISDLESQKSDLKKKVDQQTSDLASTNKQILELQKEVDSLRENITDLRRREGAITIGLSFLWDDPLQQDQKDFTESGNLEKVVWRLNGIWDDMDVYFFIWHNEVWSRLPKNVTYGSDIIQDWTSLSKSKFVGNDVPVLIVSDITHSNVMNVSLVVCGFEYKDTVVVSWKWFSNPTTSVAILTHELLHVFGISDKQIDNVMGAWAAIDPNFVIPIEWLTQIQARAKLFRMPIP